MQELLPREAPQPAGGQGPHVLPRLRLSPEDLPLPLALLLAALSGGLSFLAFPPAGLWPLAFVALAPFLWLVRASRPRRGLVLGFVFGLVLTGSVLYWILLFGELAWSSLTIVTALYPAAFGLVAPILWRGRRPVRSSVGLAALWTGLEYLRSMFPLGGFAWAGLGYTQADDGALIRLASVTGVWGVTFVVVLVNALLLLVLHRIGRRGMNLRALGLALVAAALVGGPALIGVPAPDGGRMDVAAVQVEVPKDLQLDRLLEDRLIAEMHAALHRTIGAGGDRPDLVIWAENSLDQDPFDDPGLGSLVLGAIREVGAPTLVGTITDRPDGRAFNETLLFTGDGRLADRYAKQHLVPFGEFVPWRSALDWISALDQIGRDLSPGVGGGPLELEGTPMAAAICFENTFPSLVRRLTSRGAGLIVVSTNNASYLRTAASEQHLAFSRFRAVENGRWVVHAAISGISAVIDPEGRIVERTGLFEPTVLRQTVRISDARTIYSRLGDWFAWLALVGSAGLLLAPRRRDAPTVSEEGPLGPEARTLVLLPTYQEATTIGEVLTRLLAACPEVDVLVIDDSSPDGTAAIVRTAAVGEGRVRLLERPRKRGLASAYITGFRRALQEGYDLVVEMDSDLSHQPEELPALLSAARERCDLAIGSRYVPGGSVTNWGLVRRALSRGGNAYARTALGFPITDATSGFRVFRRRLLRYLLARRISSEGYAFQIELAYQSWRAGFAVAEAPITFREREHGHSKISRRIVIEALWLVGVWGLRDRLRVPRPGPQPKPVIPPEEAPPQQVPTRTV
jgi:apolipoprotein N-acyltransferase